MGIKRNSLPVIFLLLIALTELGCASAGSGDGSRATTRRRADLLTRDEIASAQVGDLYEVVRRLRPRWLSGSRAGTSGEEAVVVVYQGQSRLGDISMLKQLPLDMAESLRFLDRASAQAQLPGPWTPGIVGAIVIQTGAGY